MISGILMLQKENSEDESVRETLQGCINRIMSVGKIHKVLNLAQDSEQVGLSHYLKVLFDNIKTAYSSQKDVELEMDLEVENIQQEKSIHFGLLMNELMTNSFKHAFEDEESGRIHISIKKNDNERVQVIYSDNGNSLNADPGELLNNESSFGMQLISIMLQYLKADYEVKSENGGFVLEFDFKMS